jgi:hypothetical protein
LCIPSAKRVSGSGGLKLTKRALKSQILLAGHPGREWNCEGAIIGSVHDQEGEGRERRLRCV